MAPFAPPRPPLPGSGYATPPPPHPRDSFQKTGTRLSGNRAGPPPALSTPLKERVNERMKERCCVPAESPAMACTTGPARPGSPDRGSPPSRALLQGRLDSGRWPTSSSCIPGPGPPDLPPRASGGRSGHCPPRRMAFSQRLLAARRRQPGGRRLPGAPAGKGLGPGQSRRGGVGRTEAALFLHPPCAPLSSAQRRRKTPGEPGAGPRLRGSLSRRRAQPCPHLPLGLPEGGLAGPGVPGALGGAAHPR